MVWNRTLLRGLMGGYSYLLASPLDYTPGGLSLYQSHPVCVNIHIFNTYNLLCVHMYMYFNYFEFFLSIFILLCMHNQSSFLDGLLVIKYVYYFVSLFPITSQVKGHHQMIHTPTKEWRILTSKELSCLWTCK